MTGVPGLESAIAPEITAPAAAQTAAPDPNPVLLKPGAEGDEVMMLQRQMRLLGLYQGPLDGRYAGPTQEAIAAFQSRAGLPASGTLDQATWQRMSTPQLLTENTPPEPEAPVLFPTAPALAESSEAKSVASAASSDAETAAPAESPEGEDQESAEPAVENAAPVETAESSRRWMWMWLGLGGLGLAGCLGGWRFLGQGRSAKRSTANSERLPSTLQASSSAEPSPSTDHSTAPLGTLGHNETLASPALGLATPAAAIDPTLDATTRLTSGDIVNSLIHDLASRDGAVRRHAIWELGQRGHSDVIQPLINGLLDADSQEKSLILAALAEISSRSLKPMHRALALGLQDPSPEVRKNAIRDLSRVYDTVVQLSHMLAHATQDPDPSVQETAQWALSQLNRIPAAAYPALPPEANSLDSPYDSLPPAN